MQTAHTEISVINQALVCCSHVSLSHEDIKHGTCGANRDVFHIKLRNIWNVSQVINASSHKGRQVIQCCTGTVHCYMLARAAPAENNGDTSLTSSWFINDTYIYLPYLPPNSLNTKTGINSVQPLLTTDLNTNVKTWAMHELGYFSLCKCTQSIRPKLNIKLRLYLLDS